MASSGVTSKTGTKRLKGFAKQRHFVVGHELHKQREELLDLSTKICAAYGSNSNAYKMVMRAFDALNSLRSELDDCLARETSREEWEEEKLQRVYYPGSKEANAQTVEPDNKFRGYEIDVHCQFADNKHGLYRVVFGSGLVQMRGSRGRSQPVLKPPTALVSIRGEHATVSWEHTPDNPNLTESNFAEEAERQVWEFRADE